jgi:hypothetical protein
VIPINVWIARARHRLRLHLALNVSALLGDWEQRLLLDIQQPRFAIGLVAVARSIIQVQAEEGKCNAKALYRRRGVLEPDNGDNDDEDALDERRDGIRDW